MSALRMIEVVVCATGMGRHDPSLPTRVAAVGATLSTVECFDRCDTCERFLVCRVDGATTRFRDSDELLAALVTLGETE
ncbi:MAG: hypothetical protein Q8P41_20935 [Pseudomonadota bacterium]|nr:hypothetical protein [Pseudomonadota bacterium]